MGENDNRYRQRSYRDERAVPSSQPPIEPEPVTEMPRRRHITQPSINDTEAEYITRERYTTLEEQRRARGGRRRHMGTADAEAEYLQPVNPKQARRQAAAPSGQGKRPLAHYDRYLQTPKPGHSIFTSQQHRQRRKMRLMVVAIVLLALVVAAVWWFFLR